MSISRRNLLGGLVAAGTCPLVAGATTTVGQPTDSRRINVLVDFSDNDYSEIMMHNLEAFKGLNAELLMRSYAYVDYQKKLPGVFRKAHNAENRIQVLNESRIVVTCCSQTVADATAGGAKTIFLATDQTIAAELGLVKALGATVVFHPNGKALRKVVHTV